MNLESNIKENKENCSDPKKVIEKKRNRRIQYNHCIYDKAGKLIKVDKDLKEICGDKYNPYTIAAVERSATGKYKGIYFKRFKIGDSIPKQLDIAPLCIIDGIIFYAMTDIRKYCNVSRQMVFQSKKKKRQDHWW